MLEKGFIKDRNKPESNENRYVSMAGRLLFYGGILVVVSGLIYMLINIEKSDSFFHIWVPYIISGIAMVCISLLFKMPIKGPRRYHR
jgi:hypothetical protein